LKFWSKWMTLQNEIFSRCSFPKLCIEDPHNDWETAYAKIVSFLQV
jgi:hypothetical protein